MSCGLGFDGCVWSTSDIRVKMDWLGKRFMCCSVCWRQLVGNEREYTPEVKANQPKLPAVPRRGAVVSGDLPLYAPPKPPGDDWL